MGETWPNFFLIGVKKGGTTSLYNYFKAIDGIFMSTYKTPGYFWPKEKQKISTDNYLKLFKDVKDEKIIGEATGYFSDSRSAKLIYEKIPNAKILLSLRDPIQRAFSDYLGQYRKGYVKESFSEVFTNYLHSKNSQTLQNVIDAGFYYESVKTFLEIFGKKQFKIIIFEEFIKNPHDTIKDILHFLDINSHVPEIVGEVYNPYREPLGDFGNKIVKNKMINKIGKKIFPGKSAQTVLRTILNKQEAKPEIPDDVKKQLADIYETDVKKLQNLLDRSLPWFINK